MPAHRKLFGVILKRWIKLRELLKVFVHVKERPVGATKIRAGVPGLPKLVINTGTLSTIKGVAQGEAVCRVILPTSFRMSSLLTSGRFIVYRSPAREFPHTGAQLPHPADRAAGSCT